MVNFQNRKRHESWQNPLKLGPTSNSSLKVVFQYSNFDILQLSIKKIDTLCYNSPELEKGP